MTLSRPRASFFVAASVLAATLLAFGISPRNAAAQEMDTVTLTGPLIGDDVCHFDEDNPITGTGTWTPGTPASTILSVTVEVDAFDVDSDEGEVDEVSLNGVLLGSLVGSEETASTTTFNLTEAQIEAAFGTPPFGPETDLTALINIDVTGNDDFCAEIDAVRVIITYEAGNLVITKSCLNGDGDADFQVNVTRLVELVAADSLDCGEVMVVPESGVLRIQELITGPDANNFLTAIVCSNASGQTTTAGTLAEVEVEGATECDIINFFNPPAPDGTTPPGGGGAPVVIVPIDITNTNNNDGTVTTTNINGGTVVNNNTNSGGQVLDNHNVEENDNINDNTQRQTVTRHQTNDSSQD